jgi:T-complex protein 1 subunit theta
MGDSTNFVVVMAGQLLQEAEFLLRMGLHAAEVIEGYRYALKKTLEIIPGFYFLMKSANFLELAIQKITDLTSEKELTEVISTSIAAKQYGYEDLLTKLVVQVIFIGDSINPKAALEIMPKNPRNFNGDSVRIVKILGASIHDSTVVKGMVFGRSPDSKIYLCNPS